MPLSQDGTESPTAVGPDRLPVIDLKRDAILLDVDGTLVDIAPSPDEVRVPAGLRGTLFRLIGHANGALALVSGRTLESIDALFAPLVTAAIGCHGAQMRRSPEAADMRRMPPLPEEIRLACSDIQGLEPHVRIEDKTFTLAFHYRQAPYLEERLRALLHDRLAPFTAEYVLMEGKSVIEIKPRQCTKGEALRALMGLPPFAGRRPVYFGDDTTDEYAFAVLPELHGIGISVGRPMPGADYGVAAPRDIRRWLGRLAGNAREEEGE
jgi:trehalose 6-phosphate phosphatase